MRNAILGNNLNINEKALSDMKRSFIIGHKWRMLVTNKHTVTDSEHNQLSSNKNASQNEFELSICSLLSYLGKPFFLTRGSTNYWSSHDITVRYFRVLKMLFNFSPISMLFMHIIPSCYIVLSTDTKKFRRKTWVFSYSIENHHLRDFSAVFTMVFVNFFHWCQSR